MYRVEHGGLVYYTFEHFERTGLVRHAFSTRLGGVSGGCHSSLNLGFSRGDAEGNVRENYTVFLDALGINGDNLIFAAQTHTANVVRVGAGHRGNGFTRKNGFRDVDGLVTNEPDVALVTFHADCVPVFLLDPVKKAIGLSHAGWKGTLNGIAEKTIKLMAESGSNPSDILAGIGPSIGPCCFETDEPVYSLFENAGFGEFVVKKGDRKGYINLWDANAKILEDAGLSHENIEVSEICTRCSPETFFSHREHGENRGSLAAIMELKKCM